MKNREAFLLRYPELDPSLIAGEYGLRLSDDGEELVLLGGGGEVARFTYNDRGGWPETPDGDGPSLVLRNPRANPDSNDPANWRPSVETGGSPGGDDGLTLGEWMDANGLSDPHGDPDGNGITHSMTYAFGGEFAPIIEVRAVEVGGVVDDYLTLTYGQNGAATDVVIVPETSSDLANWSRLDTVEISRRWQDGGVAEIVVRDALPASADAERFVRLNISIAP